MKYILKMFLSIIYFGYHLLSNSKDEEKEFVNDGDAKNMISEPVYNKFNEW